MDIAPKLNDAVRARCDLQNLIKALILKSYLWPIITELSSNLSCARYSSYIDFK